MLFFEARILMVFRGHFMATANADINIDAAAFVAMGRTTADAPFDNSVILGGQTVYVGTNQTGRYSVHLHHLHMAPTISNSVIEDGMKWGLTVHNTNNGRFTGNIVFDVDGSGIVTENGTETGNVFRENLVVKMNGGFQTDDVRAGVSWHHNLYDNELFVDFGTDGSAFWLRSTAGTFENNYTLRQRGVRV